MQVVESKAHTAGKRDLGGWGGALERHQDTRSPWESAAMGGAWEQTRGSHTGGWDGLSEWRDWAQLLRSPQASFQYQAFSGTNGFSRQSPRLSFPEL